MRSADVSCVVPAFNGGRYLAEALDSLLAQTLPLGEIIVVDDGSEDDTAAVAATFGSSIRFVRQAHAGVSAARNRGVNEARGSILAFLDADDLWLPQKLERQLAHLGACPDMDFCQTHYRNFWSTDVPVERHETDPRRGDPVWDQVRAGQIGTWLVRRELFDRVGPFREDLPYGEDTDWHLRAQDAGCVLGTLPDVLVRRRLHPGNLTAQRSAAHADGLVRMVKATLDRRRDRP